MSKRLTTQLVPKLCAKGEAECSVHFFWKKTERCSRFLYGIPRCDAHTIQRLLPYINESFSKLSDISDASTSLVQLCLRKIGPGNTIRLPRSVSRRTICKPFSLRQDRIHPVRYSISTPASFLTSRLLYLWCYISSQRSATSAFGNRNSKFLWS